MSTKARKQTRNSRLKYALFAMLTLLSVFAYTMQSTSNKAMKTATTHAAGHAIGIPSAAQEAHTPFIQRWSNLLEHIDPVLIDNQFQHTHFFQAGEIVASNDVFDLPSEATGAGVAKALEQYVMDLEDAIAAGFIPHQDSASFAGGGVGGAGGSGGGSRDKNKQGYLVTKSDIDNNHGTDTGGADHVSAVPVPSAIWLLGSAFIGLIGLRRKP